MRIAIAAGHRSVVEVLLSAADEQGSVNGITLRVPPGSDERFYHIRMSVPVGFVLSAFSSVPLVLNTSFNLAGSPIVETPADAVS